MGFAWVGLAAVLFGAGSVAQAAALARGDGGWTAGLRHPWFVVGTLAEAAGALAHVVALQTVTMAVAQCAVSGSLVVTALVARWWFGTGLGVRVVLAVGVLAAALIGLAAVGGQTGIATDTAQLDVGLAAATALIGLVGLAAAVAGRGPVLALCSGLGFAGCSTAMKLVSFTHPLSALTSAPAVIAAAAGALGCLWWTLALRQTAVTTVTAVVVVSEVVPPSLLGPLLGDSVSSWFALVAPIALGLAATACVVLARGGTRPVSAAVEQAPRVPLPA